jgi:hypothetical protein
MDEGRGGGITRVWMRDEGRGGFRVWMEGVGREGFRVWMEGVGGSPLRWYRLLLGWRVHKGYYLPEIHKGLLSNH